MNNKQKADISTAYDKVEEVYTGFLQLADDELLSNRNDYKKKLSDALTRLEQYFEAGLIEYE